MHTLSFSQRSLYITHMLYILAHERLCTRTTSQLLEELFAKTEVYFFKSEIHEATIKLGEDFWLRFSNILFTCTLYSIIT